MIVVDLPDETATAALAARIAAVAAPGDVIALKGELGTGKTTFARAFIRARAAPATRCRARPSRLVQIYAAEARRRSGISISTGCAPPEEAWELGIEDAFVEGISLIEWPERLGPLLPRRRLEIALRFRRRAEARGVPRSIRGADWRARLARSRPMPEPAQLRLCWRIACASVSRDARSQAPARQRAIAAFLAAGGWGEAEPAPLAGDASFRALLPARAATAGAPC